MAADQAPPGPLLPPALPLVRPRARALAAAVPQGRRGADAGHAAVRACACPLGRREARRGRLSPSEPNGEPRDGADGPPAARCPGTRPVCPGQCPSRPATAGRPMPSKGLEQAQENPRHGAARLERQDLGQQRLELGHGRAAAELGKGNVAERAAKVGRKRLGRERLA